MDRISRALEMARNGRTETRSPRSPAPSEAAIDAIEYTRSERLPVSRRALRRGRALTGVDHGPAVDAYRLLRTRVLHRMRQNGWNTLGVTSAGAREGKTLTSVNLGISIAMGLKNTVLVVDADLRKPSVHEVFNIAPRRGLADLLLDGDPIESLLINPGIDRFLILPGSRTRRLSSEHLASPRMEQVVHDVKQRYPGRIVIFDLPPVLVGDDVVAFAPKLDALLLVVEEGGTIADEFTRTVELLEGIEVIGTVLNKSVEVSQSYGDYYSG